MAKAFRRRSGTKPSRYVVVHLSLSTYSPSKQFFAQIIPLCFSRGSAQRAYDCLTVHHGDYYHTTETTEAAAPSSSTDDYAPLSPLSDLTELTDSDSEAPATIVEDKTLDWLPKDWPPREWRNWATNSSSYLLDPPREVGPIVAVSRGKLLVIAAGNVSR